MNLKITILLILVALHTNAPAQDLLSLKGTIFEEVGSSHQIDPLLLYSVAIVESGTGTGIGKGYIRPYPYVLRTDEGAVFYKTSEEASFALSQIIKKTHKVDIGMMQLSLKWHPQAEPLKLIDPRTNLIAAATYLKETMASTSDPVLGVGRYHNWGDVNRANWYGQRVWQVYNNLTSLMAN